MDKRKTGIFLLIFLLGLIAGFLLSSAVRGHAAADTSGSRISGRQENVPLITTGEDSALPASPEQAAVSIPAPQAILTSGPSYAEWDKIPPIQAAIRWPAAVKYTWPGGGP